MKKFIANMLFLTTIFSCENNSDFNNLSKIKKGMTIKEVDTIMGVPDSIFVDPADKSQIKYQYNASLGMSDNMYIYFSLPDSTVKYVYDGR